MKLLDPGQVADRLELVIGVQLASGPGIPLRTGQLQLAQTGQAAQPFQLGGLNQRAHQVDAADARIARRQIRQARNGIELALDGEAAALPYDPFRHLAFRRFSGGQPKDNRYRGKGGT